MKIFKNLVICILTCVLVTACQEKGAVVRQKKNSIYYWRTVLELDSVERNFLKANNVERIYIRFFDIVVDKSPLAMDAVVPNATLQVKDTMPVEELIPTVYITLDAMIKMQENEAVWAEKIVKRIYNMCSYNEFAEPKEIQLDCDWNSHTDSTFFRLCREVGKEIRLRNSEAKISATIRLHQLSQTPPPVDYGVLMLYNTGSFKNPEEDNSILTVESVKPYLKHLSQYPLHLDYAFPIFSWSLIYREDRFKGIFNSEEYLPENMLKPIGKDKYEVANDTIVKKSYLRKGDVVRREEVSFQTIIDVKKLIEKETGGKDRSIILYSLDSKNISNYSENEFKQIYQ